MRSVNGVPKLFVVKRWVVVVLVSCGRETGRVAPAPATDPLPPAPHEHAQGEAGSIPSLPDLFAERRDHPTVLSTHGASPQRFAPWPPSLDVIEYESAGLRLRGLLARPASRALAREGKSPLLVYLHGGFALDAGEVAGCRAFRDAGFFVFAPALRGENGNPGDYELAFRELDDARAAIDRARSLPDVDPARIVVFGHSAGGMLSSMLTLYADLPVLDTGSAGGLYGPGLFDSLNRPFVDGPLERKLRLFAPYITAMKHPHHACTGDADRYPRETAARLAKQAADEHLPFEHIVVAGDHFGSLRGCLKAYLARVLPEVTASP
jgi:dienelactone hydrolase